MAITDWKDATGRSLPGALGYFLLTGQVAIPTADSVDEGLNPDLIEPLGSIVLHPLQTETRFIGTADADPLTIALVDIPIKMNRAGQLFVIDGEAGARILNTSDPHLNPTNIPYEVRFEFEDIDETVKPRIAPFTILPPPPRTDGDPWVLDITQLATVAVTGQPISVEMARALVAAGWEATRKVLATADQMKATTQEAKTAAENAAGSAATAETKATEAADSASHAATSAADADSRATAAADSASKAAGSAATAETKATEAADSASHAATSAADAESRATSAAASASQAAGSAATAETKATEAATSATAAQKSADTSEVKATEAAASASQAAGSAATAETKATEAADSASHAATSAADADSRATAAAESASQAAGSAATAETKATEAATSLSEAKNLIATAPIEFQWETVQGGGGSPQVKGSWRRTGETEWKSVGVINSGVDGNSVTSAAVNPEGHLILSMSRGGTIDAGSAIGPQGVSVINASINDEYHLILELDNGSRIDAGMSRGADGKPAPILVSGHVDQTTGVLTLNLDNGQEIAVTGSLTGPVGPPPVIEAGEFSTTSDGTYSIEVPQTGNGKYAVNLHMPPPPGVSQDLVKSMVDKAISDVELLALAGI